MSNGHFRNRSERVAALVARKTYVDRVEEVLLDDHGPAKIALIFLTAAILCATIEAWNPPFTFQIFKQVDRDVPCTEPFSVEAPQKTKEAKLDARFDTPHVYINDPAKITQFKARLVNTVQSLLSVENYEAMSADDRARWAKFMPSGATPEESAAAFTKLQNVLEKDIELANFKASVDRVFRPYEKNGILLKLHGTKEGNQEKIKVYDVGTPPASAREVLVRDVLIGNAYLLKDILNWEFNERDVAGCLFQWIRPEITETLTEDKDSTVKAQNLAEESVPMLFTRYEPGQILAKGKKELDRDSFLLLSVEHQTILARRTFLQKTVRSFGVFIVLFVTLIMASVFIHSRMVQNRDKATVRTFFIIFGLMILSTVCGRLLQLFFANQGGNPEMVPLLVFAQGMTIAFSWEVAIITTLIATLALTLSGTFDLATFLVMMGTITVVVVLSRDIRRRGKVLSVACVGGLTSFVLSYATGLFQAQEIQRELIPDSALRMIWTILAGFIMAGLLPQIEKIFGLLTPMRLLEIGNPSNPLLQELARRAPATYSHSVMTAGIAEAAAEAIGARGALTRVGAYFHDIGKMLKPEYFTENQSGQNIHDTIEPRMSTLIIVAHVKDGIDLARQNRLPEPLIDLIEQHHGTMLVSFFYDRAKRLSKETTGQEIDESPFRYPGPVPQSKEAGILMLADAVESACRSIGDVSPSRIENLVRQISEVRMEDGQFDESGLTLGEIRTIENSMITSILTMKHSRIKYPDKEPESKPHPEHEPHEKDRV